MELDGAGEENPIISDLLKALETAHYQHLERRLKNISAAADRMERRLTHGINILKYALAVHQQGAEKEAWRSVSNALGALITDE